MKKFWYILIGLVVIVIILHFYIKNSIIKNITGKFNTFNLSNIAGLAVPRTDIDIDYDIINGTNYNFRVKEFKVDIYNAKTGDFLTQNEVKNELYIPKGVSNHKVKLVDNEILGNLSDFLSGQTEYLAKISFKIFFIKIEFEQLIKL